MQHECYQWRRCCGFVGAHPGDVVHAISLAGVFAARPFRICHRGCCKTKKLFSHRRNDDIAQIENEHVFHSCAPALFFV